MKTTENYLKTGRSSGFTVVELLIATAVFSTVLLISIIGFLQIGQLFYKGVTATRTHEVTRDVISGLSSDIRFAPHLSQSQDQPASATPGEKRRYFCAGHHRYTYVPGQAVNLADHDYESKFGLLRDTLDVGDSCAPPFGEGAVELSDPIELLGNRMRIGDLKITQLGINPPDSQINNLYTINVKIAYGEDSNLQDPTLTSVKCDSSLRNSQYCHVAELRTTVRRGF